MKITRVGADDQGQTYFEDVVIDVDPGAKWINSPGMNPTEVVIRTYAPEGIVASYEPHPTHALQFMIMVSGSKEIETSNGERRVFTIGDVLLMDDRDSVGHVTKTLSDDRVQLSITLPNSFNFSEWCSGMPVRQSLKVRSVDKEERAGLLGGPGIGT